MEINRKVKGLLLEVSIDDLHFPDIQGDPMEGDSCVNRSIIDELHSWDIKGDQMESESGVT